MTPAIDAALSAALAAPCDPHVAAAIDYWRRIRPSDELLPGRRHFDPVDVPRLLPHLGLLDVVREPRMRLRIRMAGTRVTDLFGPGLTGRFVDEVVPDFEGSPVERDYRRVADEGVPVWYRGKQSTTRGKTFLSIERLFLPFAEDGRVVDKILAVYLAQTSDGRRL